jgi:hypothetical protein
MSIASVIDHLYRKACVANGTTPTIKRICMHPFVFRDLAEEVRGTSRMNWYSDGQGPHFMGMKIDVAPIPGNLIILQGEDGEVVTAGLLDAKLDEVRPS